VGFPDWRVKVWEGWYPDIYIQPAPEERYPERPPLLWIEIHSEDDRMVDVWGKAAELVKNGVPYAWLIDPHTLKSELWTRSGSASVPDHTLRIPDTAIAIPLLEGMAQ
jgi:Uma2 family endonuclease